MNDYIVAVLTPSCKYISERIYDVVQTPSARLVNFTACIVAVNFER